LSEDSNKVKEHASKECTKKFLVRSLSKSWPIHIL